MKKNKKLFAAFAAGISLASIMPASADGLRTADDHMYGGGCATWSSGTGSSSSSGTSSSSSGSTSSSSGSSTSTSSSGSSSSSSGTSSGSTSSGSSSGGTSSTKTESENTPPASSNNNASNEDAEARARAERAAAVAKARDNIAKKGKSLGEKIASVLSSIKNFLSKQFESIKTAVTGFVNYVASSVKNIFNKVSPSKTVGDPVMITSGKYYTNETDLTVNYGINEFEVTRNYSSQEYPNGAFGKNWSSVFDTRIIRGTKKTELDELKKLLSSSQSEINSYKSAIISNGGSTNIPELEEAQSKLTRLSTIVNFIESNANKNQELNVYVKHGYESEAAEMSSDTLMFVDYDGGIYNFAYDYDKKNYQCTNESSANKFFIEAENEGFVIKFLDGSQRHFDKWGMLVKIEDRYSSSLEFEYSSVIQDNVRKLISVNKNGKSVLQLEWLNNKISRISDFKKNISINYEYDENNCLISFTDADRNIYRYAYDDENDLVKMIKPDNSFIKIDYSIDGNEKTKRVCSVSNEAGFKEFFDISVSDGKTVYTDPDGNVYIYKHKNDQIINEDLSAGYSVERSYNDDGMISKKVDAFETVTYSYDQYKNLVSAKYSDGSKESWTYIQPYNLLSSYTDRDGIKTDFSYSEKGSLEKISREGKIIQSYERDNCGRVTKAEGIYLDNKYAYDNDGLLISDSLGTYRYDSRERMIAYDSFDGYSWRFAYSDDNKIQTATFPGNLFIKSEYNNRNDLIKKTQKDLLSGETRVFEYEYDARHLPTEIKAGFGNDESEAENNVRKIRSFEYYASGKVKSMIDWNSGDAIENDGYGVKRSYTYKNDNVDSICVRYVDANGKDVGKKFEKNYSVEYFDGKKVLTITDEDGNKTTVKYNSYNQITEFVDANNISYPREYSPTGLLKSEMTVHGGKYNYTWDSLSEQIKTISCASTVLANFTYDNCGRLVREELPGEIKNEYEYFSNNGENSVTLNGNNFVASTVYDSLGIEKSQLIKLIDGTTVLDKKTYFNKTSNEKTQSAGTVSVENKFNAWGELAQDLNTKTKYFYDYNGNCVVIDDGKIPAEICYNVFGKISSVRIGERFVKYNYDAVGNLLKVSDNVGVIEQFIYDAAGNIVSSSGRCKPETKYEYDKSGRITKVVEAGDVVERIEYSADLKTKTVYDANGNKSIFTYDDFGELISTKNRLGNTKTVNYDRSKASVTYTDFNGNKSVVKNVPNDGSVITSYSDGTIEKIYKDPLGAVTKTENKFGSEYYSYDVGHMLNSSFANGQRIDYDYDSFGRTESIEINGKKISYCYLDNKIANISEGDFQREFSYNDYGDELIETDNSGASIHYDYDIIGRQILVYQKDRSGNIIFAEGTVYGDDGRIACTVNNDGMVTTYEYDGHGRVEKVCMPFISSFFDEAKNELEECGKSANENFVLEKIYINSSIKEKVYALLNKIGGSSSVGSYQTVWIEKYTYDLNGNRISKTTPAGKMEYEYDAENHLTKIVGPKSVVISYDANGNMISKKSSTMLQQWNYSLSNRVESTLVSDYEKDSYYAASYEYDCLGRRTSVLDSQGNKTRSVYNGLSFDKIYEWQDKGNSYAKQLTETVNNIKIRYRDIEESNMNRAYSLTQLEDKCNFDRYYLYNNGKLIAQINDKYSYSTERLVNEDVFAFCDDMRGSIRSAVGARGDYAYSIVYGFDGQPHYSTKSSNKFVDAKTAAEFGADNGFNGKQFDFIDGTYNYGFRNYSPSLSRFVTEDPIQDGRNWYAYCNGDPVNNIDLLGLKNQGADIVDYMQSDLYKDAKLGNSSTKVSKEGCYANFVSGMLNTLKNKTGDSRYALTDVSNDASNFGSGNDNDLINPWEIARKYDLNYSSYDSETESYTHRQLADKVNAYDKADENYVVAVRLQFTLSSGDVCKHWVSTEGSSVKLSDGKEYVKVIGTSKNDLPASRAGWKIEDGVIYAPIEQIIKVAAYSNKEELNNTNEIESNIDKMKNK